MQPINKRHNAFSLIELMIVVSVIGILAAIVIPRFTSANDNAKGGALASQINTVKKALILYKTDHDDTYPNEAQLITNQWQVLTKTTNISGNVSGDDYGPYFMKPPMNPFMDSNVVAADNSAGWQYDESTGVIQAVVPQAVYDRADALNLDTDDLVVGP